MDGQFACRIKRIISTAKRLGSVQHDRIKQDLEFIELNHEALDLGQMNLSSVSDAHKKTWFMQAKACMELHPFLNGCSNYKDHMRQEQDAYFAFGVVVWGIMPEPNWVLEDVRFDVWHKMGFGLVHFKHASESLFSQYQKRFARTCGIAAATFFYFHLRWNIARWRMWIDLKTDWECSKLILGSLEDFFLTKDASYEPSVYRLYQMMALSDQDYRLGKMHVKVFSTWRLRIIGSLWNRRTKKRTQLLRRISTTESWSTSMIRWI